MGEGDDGTVYWANFVVASRGPRVPERALAGACQFLTLDKLPRLCIRNFARGHFDTLQYPASASAVAGRDDDAVPRVPWVRHGDEHSA